MATTTASASPPYLETLATAHAERSRLRRFLLNRLARLYFRHCAPHDAAAHLTRHESKLLLFVIKGFVHCGGLAALPVDEVEALYLAHEKLRLALPEQSRPARAPWGRKP